MTPCAIKQLMTMLDAFSKISTFLIAVTNLVIVIRFFWIKQGTDLAQKKKDRQIESLKTLVLSNGMGKFHEFFEELGQVVFPLQRKEFTHDERSGIEIQFQDLFIRIQYSFIEGFSGIDPVLYHAIQGHFDRLQGNLSEATFASDLKLWQAPQYDEKILRVISAAKSGVVATITDYCIKAES